MKLAFHKQVAVLIGVFLVINLSMFIGMWIQACIWDTPNQPCNMQTSFSRMLADDQRVKEWFMAWWGMYVMIRLGLLYLVSRYYIHHEYCDHLLEENVSRRRFWEHVLHQTACSMYLTFTTIYGILTIVTLVFLPFILYFPVNDDSTESLHYIFASITFGSAIACCVALFIRRMLLIGILKQIRFYWVIVFFNVLELVGQFVMGACFVGLGNGIFEFIMSILIVLDTSFQIVDFYYDKDHSRHYCMLFSLLAESSDPTKDL